MKQIPLSEAAKRRLLSWFDRNARVLPWRLNRDPYRIWISEVMLQQTTVATAIPRFEKFVERFPDVTCLAEADEQEVLHYWHGLGYYNRARNLHRSARILREQGYENLPNDPELCSSLPGVGPYILGAILSQAFDLKFPIVEANTKRLYARIFAKSDDITSKSMSDWFWSTAKSILPKKNIGNFNQALMELGALVCTPRNPDCKRCPLSNECLTYRDGLQESIPTIAKRKEFVKLKQVTAVIHRDDKVLLLQRPATGRWANMWEFPTRDYGESETALDGIRILLKELKIKASIEGEIGSLKYTVMHYRFTLNSFRTKTQSDAFRLGEYMEGRWLTLSELKEYPLSSPQRKLANLLSDSKQLKV